uniref:Uncharacterized protein n=1 Tax=Rhizophora mucronata TaxID=61149 RepID=A0A2P2PN77_RHIMU
MTLRPCRFGVLSFSVYFFLPCQVLLNGEFNLMLARRKRNSSFYAGISCSCINLNIMIYHFFFSEPLTPSVASCLVLLDAAKQCSL